VVVMVQVCVTLWGISFRASIEMLREQILTAGRVLVQVEVIVVGLYKVVVVGLYSV
jgi:hypothetical protein